MLWISLKIHTRGIQIKDLKEGAAVMLAELAVEAGLPNGVLNIVHGSNEIVNAICDDDDVKAISFAGLNVAGTYVYARASAKGKRVQLIDKDPSKAISLFWSAINAIVMKRLD